MEDGQDQDTINQASKRLSSHEQIHQTLTIEEPRNWVVTFVILLLLLVLIIWSFIGKIPTETTGRSVSLSPEGVFLVRSKSSGVITEIFIDEGEVIEKGSPIVRIYNPTLQSLLKSIEGTRFKIEKLEVELELLERAVSINQKLFQEGLIAKMVLDNSKAEAMNKEIAIEETRSSLATLFSDLENTAPTYDSELLRESESLLFENIPDNLEKIETQLSTITAPSKGRVLEVLVNIGDIADKKQSIIWVERPHKAKDPELFYGAIDADIVGRIRPGMKTIIEPNIANPQEYGAIHGKVTEIFPYPVSKEELAQNIGNMQIVQYLLGNSAAITNVIVEPEIDSTTISGYKWTSGKGPPFSIPTGTICTIKVIIDEQPPISYLIPLWKIKPK